MGMRSALKPSPTPSTRRRPCRHMNRTKACDTSRSSSRRYIDNPRGGYSWRGGPGPRSGSPVVSETRPRRRRQRRHRGPWPRSLYVIFGFTRLEPLPRSRRSALPLGPAPIRCKKRMCFLVNSAKCPPQAKNFQGRSKPPGTHRTALTTGRGRRSDVASYFRRAGPAALAG
jgi:hypothetical protein